MVSDTNPRKVHLLRKKARTKHLSGASRGRRAKQEPVDVLDLNIAGWHALCNLAWVQVSSIRRSETRWTYARGRVGVLMVRLNGSKFRNVA